MDRHNCITVIIPTCGRPTKLQHCLRDLGRQILPPGVTLEVIVVVDGRDNRADYEALEVPAHTRFLHLPRGGIGVARNAGIAAANGTLLIITNDDTYPVPEWAHEHLKAHQLLGRPGLVVGLSRYQDWPDPTVFDALVRDTSLVFFYDGMQSGQTYGFRHAFGCNTSLPRALAQAVGGYDERLRPYGYEDLEFAFRLEQAGHPGVYYHAPALNIHDHRMTWADYCRRETCLGRMAACLALVNLDCFEAIFHSRDSDALRARFASWLEFDRGDQSGTADEIARWAARPRAEVHDWPAVCPLLLRTLLPVKRRCFREGFVSGFDLRADAHWLERLALGHSFP